MSLCPTRLKGSHPEVVQAKPPSWLRSRAIRCVWKALDGAEVDGRKRETYARVVEGKTYRSYRCDREGYARALRRVVWNLQNNAKRLYAEYPDAEILPSLGDQELGRGTSAEKFVTDNEERERKLREINAGRGGLEESNRTLLRCHRTPSCRNSKVTWGEVQSRGADEASTIHAICSNCGATWKL